MGASLGEILGEIWGAGREGNLGGMAKRAPEWSLTGEWRPSPALGAR
jgi:hypothetical protein